MCRKSFFLRLSFDGCVLLYLPSIFHHRSKDKKAKAAKYTFRHKDCLLACCLLAARLDPNCHTCFCVRSSRPTMEHQVASQNAFTWHQVPDLAPALLLSATIGLYNVRSVRVKNAKGKKASTARGCRKTQARSRPWKGSNCSADFSKPAAQR